VASRMKREALPGVAAAGAGVSGCEVGIDNQRGVQR
jgi:hypothetical protein